MTDGYQMIEIVFLAMLAGFVALRLYSVLGRRTGHQGEPAGDIFSNREQVEPKPSSGGTIDAPTYREIEMPAGASSELQRSLRAIADADMGFDPAGFVDGASAAYRLILEAFWRGDEAALRPLVSDEILGQFARSIAVRAEERQTVENRLVALESAKITEAQLEGAMAEVTVRFDSRMIAVTRDADGKLLSGSTETPVETHDLWTFSRHMRSSDPNWLLIATDAEA